VHNGWYILNFINRTNRHKSHGFNFLSIYYRVYDATIFCRDIDQTGTENRETAEMTYTFDVVNSDFLPGRPGAEDAKAWIEFWWTDPAGSYLTAKQAVQIPVSEVVVSGNTTWEGDYTKTRLLH